MSEGNENPSPPLGAFAFYYKEGVEYSLTAHCDDLIEKGFKECLFLCFPHRRTVLAKAVPFQSSRGAHDKVDEVFDFYKQIPWWKRYSLYSFIGFQEVEINIVSTQAEGYLEVVTSPADYTADITQLQHKVNEMRQLISDSTSCGVEANGTTHRPDERCPNYHFSTDETEGFCPVIMIYNRLSYLESLRRRPAFLDFFWEHRNGKISKDFLNSSGFVYTYEELRSKRYVEAKMPYGPTFNAILFVKGWKMHYFLIILALSLCASTIAIALTTIIAQSVQTGLAVGSYVLAIAALLTGTFTTISSLLQ